MRDSSMSLKRKQSFGLRIIIKTLTPMIGATVIMKKLVLRFKKKKNKMKQIAIFKKKISMKTISTILIFLHKEHLNKSEIDIYQSF